ncbi:hypothetical protein J6590_051372 [Homalodisca vitripennis]|nr:hypothetical protein J6590_051372 [Homalodisca vitripennis]
MKRYQTSRPSGTIDGTLANSVLPLCVSSAQTNRIPSAVVKIAPRRWRRASRRCARTGGAVRKVGELVLTLSKSRSRAFPDSLERCLSYRRSPVLAVESRVRIRSDTGHSRQAYSTARIDSTFPDSLERCLSYRQSPVLAVEPRVRIRSDTDPKLNGKCCCVIQPNLVDTHYVLQRFYRFQRGKSITRRQFRQYNTTNYRYLRPRQCPTYGTEERRAFPTGTAAVNLAAPIRLTSNFHYLVPTFQSGAPQSDRRPTNRVKRSDTSIGRSPHWLLSRNEAYASISGDCFYLLQKRVVKILKLII